MRKLKNYIMDHRSLDEQESVAWNSVFDAYTRQDLDVLRKATFWLLHIRKKRIIQYDAENC